MGSGEGDWLNLRGGSSAIPFRVARLEVADGSPSPRDDNLATRSPGTLSKIGSQANRSQNI